MNPAVADALACAISHRLPVALYGAPGVGKTSLVEAIGADLGAHVEVFILAQSEPTDVAGIPYISTDGYSRTATPEWVERVNDHTPAIVFLDEFSQASALHQGVCNDIIQSRRVGNIPLADHVRFVAGYNPPELCGGHDLSLPTRNRFIHLGVDADPDQFADGLAAGWPLPNATITPSDRSDAEANWRRTVGAFVKARPGLLVALPPLGTTGGFPTPRSLELAAKAAAAADADQRSEAVRDLLVEGCIGPAAASELLSYARELDLPDPAQALAQPDTIELPNRPDRAWAAMTAIADTAIRHANPDAWNAAWRIAARIAHSIGADIAAVAVQQLAQNPPPGARPPAEAAIFRDLFAA